MGAYKEALTASRIPVRAQPTAPPPRPDTCSGLFFFLRRRHGRLDFGRTLDSLQSMQSGLVPCPPTARRAAAWRAKCTPTPEKGARHHNPALPASPQAYCRTYAHAHKPPSSTSSSVRIARPSRSPPNLRTPLVLPPALCTPVPFSPPPSTRRKPRIQPEAGPQAGSGGARLGRRPVDAYKVCHHHRPTGAHQPAVSARGCFGLHPHSPGWRERQKRWFPCLPRMLPSLSRTDRGQACCGRGPPRESAEQGTWSAGARGKTRATRVSPRLGCT